MNPTRSVTVLPTVTVFRFLRDLNI
jgi:hypothetical protein